MVFFNTYSGFLYRQFFLTPALITSETHSMVGKTGIVTGSNSGLGYHASSQLLALGLSHLILAVRDTRKGEAAKTSLLATHRQSGGGSSSKRPPPTVEVWPVDLTEFTSIAAFAERVRDTPDLTVDFCILNAGVARFGFEIANGNELTVQTNWLGTALLAITLRPILQAQYNNATTANANGHFSSYSSNTSVSRPPVLSIVGSETAQWAVFKEAKIAKKERRSVLNVLNDKERFNMGDRYYTSKLLLALFFREFVNRLPADDEGKSAVVVNMVNPGFCYGSELHRSLSGPLGKVFGWMKRAIGRRSEVGARTLVHGAIVAGSESHGRFLSDEKVAPFMDFLLTAEGQACGRQMWKEMSDELATQVDVNAVMKEG